MERTGFVVFGTHEMNGKTVEVPFLRKADGYSELLVWKSEQDALAFAKAHKLQRYDCRELDLASLEKLVESYKQGERGAELRWVEWIEQ